MLDIKLLPAQDDFIFNGDKFPLIRGGLGSGKSRAGTLSIVMKMLNDREANTAYYMPTYDLLDLRARTGIEEDLEMLKIRSTYNSKRNKITLRGRGDIILRSYDRPERIVAYEVAHSVVDELDTIKKDKASFVWRKISERNRQRTSYMKKRKIPNILGCVTTPDYGVNGFVYDKWEKKRQKGYVTYVAKTLDNIYLDEEYINDIRNNYDEVMADLYLNGEYVSLSRDKVYHAFNRKRHSTNRTIAEDDIILHCGIDFNIGGVTATLSIIEDNKVYAVDEIVGNDTMDLCIKISTKHKDKKIFAYPDSSGKNRSTNASQTDIQILRDFNFHVFANNANPPVRDRINSVNGMLSHDRIFVNLDKCPDLAFALESQGYNAKGEPEKFNEHPAIDDWCDNFGYFIYYKFPLKRSLYRSYEEN